MHLEALRAIARSYTTPSKNHPWGRRTDRGRGERMTPKDFLKVMVQPNVADFKTRFDDLRLAFNAVAAVDALAAQLYVWCQANAPSETAGVPDDSHYRGRLAQANDDFALLRDIAKANKHVHLTKGTPQVSRAGQVSQKQLGWGVARWGEGRWGSPPQVVVDTNGGETRVVETIVDAALAFLEGEMQRIGVP